MLGGGSPAAVSRALDPRLAEAASRYPDRSIATRSERELRVFAARRRAIFSAWYELFPRSMSREPGRHGTFADAERTLPYVRELGFDIVYLPPIHPVGRTARRLNSRPISAREAAELCYPAAEDRSSERPRP